MSDKKHLVLKGNTWSFNWRIPKDCKDVFSGKTFITKSLKTHSIKEARVRRNQMLAEIEQQIQEHRHGHSEAKVYRQAVRELVMLDKQSVWQEFVAYQQKISRMVSEGVSIQTPNDLPNKLAVLPEDERLKLHANTVQAAFYDNLADPAERARAKAVQNVALGYQSDLAKVTLKEALEQHLKDNGPRLKVNTCTQTRKAVKSFLEYVGKSDVALESIGRKQVHNFIGHASDARSGSTVKTYLSYLSSIWKHARNLEDVTGDNPFNGHKIERETESYQEFDKAHLEAIFRETKQYRDATDDYYKYLLPRLGYMTGCRIEELCSLQCDQIIKDPESGIMYLAVRNGKTSNAKRKIPLHDWVRDDVARQKERVGSGLLFPSLTSQRNDGKHGDKASKWFGRLKKGLQIPGGRSRSFHSFRVHMATNLENGGVEEATAVWIMGHTRNLSLTYGLYSKGKAVSELKAAMDTISVPIQERLEN